jgi:GH25 family lysozyme M1 (1,4-beta-N-acetylmuramidase)
MPPLVLDVNSFHPARLDDVKASGCVALIAKATEGATFSDASYAPARNVAHAAGIPFGGYLFLRTDSKGNEAQHFLSVAKPRTGDIQPVIDAEDLAQGSRALAKRADACAHALEAHGYRPILYASASAWVAMHDAVPALRRLRVWEADYPGRFTRWTPRLAKLRIRLRHGATVVMWQWTPDYTVNGRTYDASALLAPLAGLRIPPAT